MVTHRIFLSDKGFKNLKKKKQQGYDKYKEKELDLIPPSRGFDTLCAQASKE